MTESDGGFLLLTQQDGGSRTKVARSVRRHLWPVLPGRSCRSKGAAYGPNNAMGKPATADGWNRKGGNVMQGRQLQVMFDRGGVNPDAAMMLRICFKQ